MVKCSYEQKPFRREVMRTYGANVTPSPSNTTEVGRRILAEFPDTTGSLGCAISEAVEAAASQEGYRYVLGSVLNQVLLHQSVIGLETMAALEKYHVKPDTIIGCAGGGSNLGGLISPFVGQMLRGEADYRIIAVEPASCPSLTRGVFKYDFCDTGKICPMAKMYTLGNGFIPSANHAGGLRYHGMSSIVSQLYHDGHLEARSVEQTAVFEAAELFARCEGILPAPESSHAIRVAMDEALKCKETGEERTIVLGLTGTGYFDMVAYGKYNDGVMSDTVPTDELACTMEQLCAAAAYLLRSGGQFCLVYRTERLAELMETLRRHRLEPKVLRFVQKNAASAPSLLLLACRKDGGTGLTVQPPLLLQNDDGTETPELRRIYFKEKG